MRRKNASNRLMLRFMVLVSLIGLGLWWPASRDIKRLEADVVSTQKRLMGVDGQARGITELFMYVRRMRQSLAVGNRFIPERSDIGPLLGSLSNRMEELGMRDLRISTPQATVHTGYVAQPIDVRLTGYAMEVLELLEHIEWLPRLVQLKSLKMRIDPNTGQVTADLALETYHYITEEEMR